MQNSRGVIRGVDTGNLIVAGTCINCIALISLNLPGELNVRRGERLAIRQVMVRPSAEMPPFAAVGISVASSGTRFLLASHVPRPTRVVWATQAE